MTAGPCSPRSPPAAATSVQAATADLVGADFGLGVLDDDALGRLSELLRPVRRAAGDF